MALKLFSHTADLMPGLYTKTKARGAPPPKDEHRQRTDEYIQVLAREEASRPTLLPNSKLFNNQVSCTKARASLLTLLGHVPSQPRPSSQCEQIS